MISLRCVFNRISCDPAPAIAIAGESLRACQLSFWNSSACCTRACPSVFTAAGICRYIVSCVDISADSDPVYCDTVYAPHIYRRGGLPTWLVILLPSKAPAMQKLPHNAAIPPPRLLEQHTMLEGTRRRISHCRWSCWPENSSGIACLIFPQCFIQARRHFSIGCSVSRRHQP